MLSNFRFLFVILFLVFSLTEVYSQSTICNYGFRKRITFDPAQVAGPNDLTNYPAMIKIVSDANIARTTNGGNVTSANGYDIIFTAADGVTKLDHQLEYYGTSATGGLLTAWVRIPVLSTSVKTDIYMYYGNSGITTDQSLTSTWNSNYKGVYHLHSDYADKSGNGNNGTNSGLTLSTGTIANAATYNNVNDYASIGTSGWSATNATYEMWVNSTAAWNAAEAYFLGHTTLPAYNNRIQIYAYNGRLRLGLGNSHNLNNDLSGALGTNRFYHVAVTYASGTCSVYLNGASVYTGAYTGLTTIGQADIGNNGNNHTEAMAGGKVDNLFISNTTRDANWIATVYNNQSSPTTFYSISTQPKVWNGASSTVYNAAANWVGASAPIAGEDVIINNVANQPVLSSDEQVGAIWIKTGANLSLSNRTLSFRYDITNCGTITGNTGFVNCNSSSTYAQRQYMSGSGTYNLNNLTVNNTYSTSPAVELVKDVNVSGALLLTSGIFYTTSTYILALGNGATSSSGSAASFVSGPMSKSGNADFIFPVGKGAKWRRCGVSSITAASTFTAEYFTNPYASTTPVNAPLTNVSLVEYWQCDRTGAGNANLTLYWEDASLSGVTTCTDLTIARWNGSSWDERPGTASGSCSGTGAGNVITNAALTAFSPFTFGSKTPGSINPLPITLLTFTAIPAGKNVRVNWSTATEKDVDYYEVERSKDGINFEFVDKIKSYGNGNSTSIMNYTTVDQSPYKGVSYYRLKQMDKDKTAFYSSVVTVNFNEALNVQFTLYPNPANKEFFMEGVFNENAELIISNVLGQIITPPILTKTNFKINVDCSLLPAGVYFITVKMNDELKTQKLIIK